MAITNNGRLQEIDSVLKDLVSVTTGAPKDRIEIMIGATLQETYDETSVFKMDIRFEYVITDKPLNGR